MAITTTPLGFQKPDGNDPIRNGDNVIAANGAKAEELHQDARGRLTVIEAKNAAQDGRLNVVESKNATQDARLANLDNAAGFTGDPLALNDAAFAETLTNGTETAAALDERLEIQVPPIVAATIASDPTVANSAATMAQSTAGLVPVFKATTAYTAGQRVISPGGDVVAAKINFTSGAAYSATNWNASTQDGRIGVLEAAKWYQGGLLSTSPVNGALGSIKDGTHRATSDTRAVELSLPDGRAGKLTQMSSGTFGIHFYESLLGQSVRLWSSTSSSWGAWTKPAAVYTDAAMNSVKWYQGGLTAVAPINDPLGAVVDGDYRVTQDSTAASLGLPDGRAGNFKQVSYGTFGFQSHTSITGTSARLWTGSAWGAWTTPSAGTGAPSTTSQPASGMKLVPLALSLGQGNTDYPVTTGTTRIPMWWGAPVSRFRVHIRNINPRENFVRTGAVTFGEGLWIGTDATGDGQATGLTQVVGAFTTPENGDGWVSGWVDYPLAADSKHLLSYSFTATGTVQSCEGGSWKADGLVASSTGGTTWTRSLDAPFDVWLEAETPATVPVVAVIGDSLSAGTTATMPVHDSPMSQHMRAWGGLPIHYAAVGDTFNSYNGGGTAGSETYKKTRWLDLAKPDSVLIALGSNDIFGQAVSLATAQSRFATTLAWAKSALSETVFLSTITPRTAVTGATEDVRRSYNVWLKQQSQPGGVARGVFDFAAAISSDDETIDPAFDGDTIHLTTAGYAAEAATLHNLTSPAVMYRS